MDGIVKPFRFLLYATDTLRAVGAVGAGAVGAKVYNDHTHRM